MYVEILKIVRDKIPELPGHPDNISFDRVAPNSVLSGLYDKLHEEVEELKDATDSADRERIVEEAGDVLEVLYAILKRKGISLEEVKKRRLEKLKEKGGFKKGMLMITNEEGECENR